MGDPATELRTWRLRREGVTDAERRGQVVPHLGCDPVGRTPGDPVQGVAHVEQLASAALEINVGNVPQPRRHQRLQDGGVTEPAAGLLEVRK